VGTGAPIYRLVIGIVDIAIVNATYIAMYIQLDL